MYPSHAFQLQAPVGFGNKHNPVNQCIQNLDFLRTDGTALFFSSIPMKVAPCILFLNWKSFRIFHLFLFMDHYDGIDRAPEYEVVVANTF